MAIKKYLKIYTQYLRFYFIEKTTYRISFFIELFVEIGYFISHLIFFTVVYSHTNSIAGWEKGEMLFLIGLYTFAVQLILTLVFIGGFRRLPEILIKGEFDFVLLKPLNALFQISFARPYLTGLIVSFLGFVLMFYAVFAYNLQIRLINLIFFIFTFINGLIIAYSLHTLINSLAFTFKYNIVIGRLVTRALNISRYPAGIFENLIMKTIIFIFFPVIYFTSIPAQILIKELNFKYVFFSFILAVIFLKISIMFWNYQIKKYASASS